ncbi:MAG: protein kinase, partial [Planctomycetaceae bacterium]
VYGVGCERNVHFYAMRFIEGDTLAHVIEQLRQGTDAKHPGWSTEKSRSDQRGGAEAMIASNGHSISRGADAFAPTVLPDVPPAPIAKPSAPLCSTVPVAAFSTDGSAMNKAFFRAAAMLARDVARALDYAHERGIVHRDIKPSNLMLDAAGKAWVTDFGLARIESDVNLTLSGDLLGTLRYMSPEQLLARRAILDHRTDVYSLGITFYELLTLTPAFPQSDRQELIRRISFDDPAPPRQLNPKIPRELETILVKATEKNPTERYQTAEDLADDLQRFLDDQPIVARPPSGAYLVTKFVRRHRTGVLVTAALSAAALLLALGAGWVALDQSMQQAQIEQAVSLAWDEADRWEKAGRWSDALSAAQRAVDYLGERNGSEELRLRARRRRDVLQLVMRLDEVRMENSLGPTVFAGIAGDQALGDELYTEAFREFGLDADALEPEEFVRRIPEGPIRLELAAALDDWAVMRRRGVVDAADDKDWRKVLATARAVDPTPAHNRLRDLWELSARGGEPTVEEVAALPLDKLRPSSLRMLSQLQNLGQATVSLREFQKKHPGDFWLNLALGSNLAIAASVAGSEGPAQMDEAAGFLRAALAARPDSSVVLANLGRALANGSRPHQSLIEGIAYLERAVRAKPNVASWQRFLGEALAKAGRLDEAALAYRNAIGFAPKLPYYYTSLGEVLMRQRKWDEAVMVFDQAIQLNPNTKKKIAQIYNDFAWQLATDADQNLRDPLRAVEFAERAVAMQDASGECWNTLGVARYRNRDWAGALECLQKARELRSGGDGFDWFFAAMTHWQLGHQTEAHDWYRKAVAWRKNHQPDNPELQRSQGEAAELLGLRAVPVWNTHINKGPVMNLLKTVRAFGEFCHSRFSVELEGLQQRNDPEALAVPPLKESP